MFCHRADQPQSGTLMDRYVLGFVTLKEILRFFARSVMCVPFELGITRELLDDDSADSPGFGIPAHVVTDDKRFLDRGNPLLLV